MKKSDRQFAFGLGIFFLVMASIVIFAGWAENSQLRKINEKRIEQEKAHPSIVHGDYVELTIMGCHQIRKTFKKEDTVGLTDDERDYTFCATQYENFYLKSSIIHTKLTIYSVDLEWYGKDNRSAKITKYNVPYCQICTAIRCFNVRESCEDIP